MFKKIFAKIKEIGKKVINKVKSVIEKITEWLNRHPKVVKVVGAALSVVMTIGVFVCGGLIGRKVGIDEVMNSDEYINMKKASEETLSNYTASICVASYMPCVVEEIGNSKKFSFDILDTNPVWVSDSIDESFKVKDLGSYGERLTSKFGLDPEYILEDVITTSYIETA